MDSNTTSLRAPRISSTGAATATIIKTDNDDDQIKDNVDFDSHNDDKKPDNDANAEKVKVLDDAPQQVAKEMNMQMVNMESLNPIDQRQLADSNSNSLGG